MKNVFIKSVSLALCVIAGATLMSACGDNTVMNEDETLSGKYTRTEDVSTTYNFNDGVEDVPITYNTYTNEITDYELKLFRNIYKNRAEKSGSFVTAPVNAVLQLGLVANGMSNDNQKEFIRAVADDLKLDAINQCSSYFKSRIQAVANIDNEEYDKLAGKKISSDSTSYVKLNNTLVFNNNSDVKKKFLQTNADYYSTDIYRIDFANDNSLVKLNNALADYSDEAFAELNNEDRMFSVTASDICDKWLEAYAKSDISEGVFNSSNGEAKVNYLTSNESYMHTDNAVGIVKYMSKTPLKLVMIMPDEKLSLDEYIGKLTNAEYTALFDSIDIRKKATAKIPEFAVNSGKAAVSHKDAVTSSGLYTLFTEDAKFSVMTSSDGFMFNDMYEVAPQVTVNAAGIGGKSSNDASAVMSERTKKLDKTDVSVEFNRPFVFMVIDNESSIPLYVGTVDITE